MYIEEKERKGTLFLSFSCFSVFLFLSFFFRIHVCMYDLINDHFGMVSKEERKEGRKKKGSNDRRGMDDRTEGGMDGWVG